MTPGTVIQGRAALARAIADLLADPRGLSARLTGAVEAQGRLFRFRSVVEARDGRVVFDGRAGDYPSSCASETMIPSGPRT